MEEIQTTEKKDPESQEYIKNMVDKADGQETLPDTGLPDILNETSPDNPDVRESKSQRPTWLPGKFKTPEDMAKAYQQLESKMGGQSKNAEEASDNTTQPKGDPGNLSLEKFKKEISEYGQLSDNSIEELDKQGIDRDVIESYQDGIRARQEIIRRDTLDVVGGEEEYNKMIEWAQNNLSEKETQYFDEQVGTDKEKTLFAVKALNAQYRNANGVQPKLSKAGGRPGASGFESWSQVQKAMGDPRYKDDPAYRQKVETLMANSNLDA